MLIVAEIAIPDEGTRLLAFGVVVAGVFAIGLCARALFSVPRVPRVLGPAVNGPSEEPTSRTLRPRTRGTGEVAIACAAILLLRWIPFSDVRIGRELFLLVIAALIVLVLDRTPFAVAVAVIVVLITPAIPLRTLLLPVAVLFVAVLAKVFGMHASRADLALDDRACVRDALLCVERCRGARVSVLSATRASRRCRDTPSRRRCRRTSRSSSTFPRGATSLIVSGANVARMTRGTPLGRIEPGGRDRAHRRRGGLGSAAPRALLRHAQSAAARSGGASARLRLLRLDRRRGTCGAARTSRERFASSATPRFPPAHRSRSKDSSDRGHARRTADPAADRRCAAGRWVAATRARLTLALFAWIVWRRLVPSSDPRLALHRVCRSCARGLRALSRARKPTCAGPRTARPSSPPSSTR